MNYDYSYFHKDCSGVYVNGDNIICPVCKVIANLEAVSGKINPGDACKVGKDIDREIIGKISQGVSK
jgi:hypothetical protein